MKTPLLALLLVLPATLPAATNSWSLGSPDGRCAISVTLSTGGELTYQAFRESKPVLLPSPLGLCREDQAFDHGLTLAEAGNIESRREQYELFAGVTPQVDHRLNHRRLIFSNTNHARLALELAASDEGVAFRYRFEETASEVRVLRTELTGFTLPSKTRGWLQPYHAASDYTPAYEDFYFHVSPGERPPRSRGQPLGWSFPALFEVPEANAWVLLTESGTDGSYCACHLGADSSGGLYRMAFAAANEATKRQTNHVGPEPRSTLPWTMPWRVLVLGQSAKEIATATLVTDLAAPSRVTDTSWIRPGRASWGWWSYPEGPSNAELFNKFSDFAARMGWEYTLFDAGWWTPGLQPIAEYARARGVAPLAWCGAGDFYSPTRRQRRLEEMQAAGVRGVKVDFWCSDRQEAIATMHALFEDAAARHLLVNLHGCTLPRGWQRTWPNFLTAEAVLGAESYFYESKYTEKAAELNTVLPFTRNAVGPMDLTPVACSPKKYTRTTTAAHELAAALIFTSGLIHYADRPEFFESLPPEALAVLRDAPARWDETRCLEGEPGKMVVFARRTGPSWFVSGINGTSQPLPVTLDLTPFAKPVAGANPTAPRCLLIAEGSDAKMQLTVTPTSPSDHWQHELPPRGGFILRIQN